MTLVTQGVDASAYVIVPGRYVGGGVVETSVCGFGGHGGRDCGKGNDDATILEE